MFPGAALSPEEEEMELDIVGLHAREDTALVRFVLGTVCVEYAPMPVREMR